MKKSIGHRQRRHLTWAELRAELHRNLTRISKLYGVAIIDDAWPLDITRAASARKETSRVSVVKWFHAACDSYIGTFSTFGPFRLG